MAVVRDALEAVTRLLPSAARAEMRRLLDRLDEEFRRGTLPDFSPGTTGLPPPWWHRRAYRD